LNSARNSRRGEKAPSVSVHWQNLGRAKKPDTQALQAWDNAAEDWDRFVETGADYHRWRLHGPALLKAVGDVRGLKVLDVACGQGWFSRQLASRGARVVGIDWSSNMISRARDHEKRSRLRIKYLQCDASRIEPRFAPKSFDLVTSCMALMDMPRVEKALAGVSSILKVGGRFVFSVSHPVNSAPEARWLRRNIGHHGPWLLDGYFDEGPNDILWKLRGSEQILRAPHWHRTLASWFRLIGDSGLVVTGLWEPRSTAKQAQQTPGFEGVRRIPFYLIIESRPVPRLWA
jgi:ubiquinone/menaquinone biosynthesis C-methylase UbiE